MYVKLIDGKMRALGRLPRAARRLDTGQWVMDLANASDEDRAACGWFPVVRNPRPVDTETVTWEREIVTRGGIAAETWVERERSADEQAAAVEEKQRSTAREQARQALAANVAYLDAKRPTAATHAEQIAALTRQVTALIRLVV